MTWREGARTVDLGLLAEQTCFCGKRPSEKTTIASTFWLILKYFASTSMVKKITNLIVDLHIIRIV